MLARVFGSGSVSVTGASGEPASTADTPRNIAPADEPHRYRSDLREMDARVACQQATRDQLLASRTARSSTPYQPAALWNDLMDQWQYAVNLEAQNAFGVPVRVSWRCETPLGGTSGCGPPTSYWLQLVG